MDRRGPVPWRRPPVIRSRSTAPASGRVVALLVLAAGRGSRMQSAIPKPLHRVAGIPMIDHVLRAGAGAKPTTTVVVVGEGSAPLEAHLDAWPDVLIARQPVPRGTGDAARRGLAEVPAVDWLVVLFADHPLLTSGVVAQMVLTAGESGALVTLLTVTLDDAAGYGRIERDDAGRVRRVVERRDDDPRHRLGPTEINSGMMALRADWARDVLASLPASGATGEYYLTDLVAAAAAGAREGDAWPVATVPGEPEVALGVNDRVELAAADQVARTRVRQRLLRSGVTLVGPETIFIEEGVEVGVDSTILPFSSLSDGTIVGEGCTIGPSAVIARSKIGDRVIVRSSTIEESTVGDDADVGPYAHLRNGTEIGVRAHVGNYAELKNVRLGAGVKVGHFSYLGDADIGPETNIGAGTVTANFDGQRKHRTTIGAAAFIGSDTVLRAPVVVGDGARTGAGSVVTKDVPDHRLVVGVPARLVPIRSAASAVEWSPAAEIVAEQRRRGEL